MPEPKKAGRQSFAFLEFCDHIWARLGHTGGMSNAQWMELSFEERMSAIAIWRESGHYLPEARAAWDRKYPPVHSGADDDAEEQIDERA